LIRAAEYYRLSADQGNSYGQSAFGRCLENGLGIGKDLIRAAEYYRLSAEQGNSDAQNQFRK
jgi:TPR repeat protein